MSTALENVTREAVHLHRDQRLALARILVVMDEPAANEEVDRTWDAEMRERVLAVQEGRTISQPDA
jgi:hypothetical protein